MNKGVRYTFPKDKQLLKIKYRIYIAKLKPNKLIQNNISMYFV